MTLFDLLSARRWREWVVRDVCGDVLELGVGTGSNLPYYRQARTIVAIDPNSGSLTRAAKRREGTVVALYRASAEELPFADESFDAVVATLVLCSVGDPERGLVESRRVLKTGGMLRLVEHVRVQNPMGAGIQDALTPLWKRVAGNCHLNRDTLSSVEQAGFQVRTVTPYLGGLVIGIDAVKS